MRATIGPAPVPRAAQRSSRRGTVCFSRRTGYFERNLRARQTTQPFQSGEPRTRQAGRLLRSADFRTFPSSSIILANRRLTSC